MTKNAEYRKAFLEEVIKTVCADRNITHGDAEDNFRTIAAMWTSYLGVKGGSQMPSINSSDVAVMMALFKCARIAVNPAHMDNWVDLAGYAACGGGIMTPRNRKDEDATGRYDAQTQPSNFANQPNSLRIGTEKPAHAEVEQERDSIPRYHKVYVCDGPAGKQIIAARTKFEAASMYSEANNCGMLNISVISAQVAP